jgi:hypothetical protein
MLTFGVHLNKALIILTRIVLAEQGLHLTVVDCLTRRTSVSVFIRYSFYLN